MAMLSTVVLLLCMLTDILHAYRMHLNTVIKSSIFMSDDAPKTKKKVIHLLLLIYMHSCEPMD